MGMITICAPLSFGVMMGWISANFIRKEKEYEYKGMWKTAGGFLTGVALSSWGFIISPEMGVEGIMYYMMGHSIGFFLHRK